MKLWLAWKLAEHRRGRFLSNQLDAIPMDVTPEEGVILAFGKDFQEMPETEQEQWLQWCSRPGRTLLLLPPFQSGAITSSLDWRIEMIEGELEGEGVYDLLSLEVDQHLLGEQGESDRQAGHLWLDHSINTRYNKRHSSSGVFAVTCLPLWSIALMDQAQASIAWLEQLHSHAGKAQEAGVAQVTAAANRPQLVATDYTLMVCLYGFNVSSQSMLLEKLAAQTVPIVTLDGDAIDEGLQRLADSQFWDGQQITEAGMVALRSSPYWDYAEYLLNESLRESAS